MSGWTQDELDRIGQADELEVASFRPDGTVRKYVIVWGVRLGDAVYVRSGFGKTNPWYQRARSSGTGRLRAGGVERDIRFSDARDPELGKKLDAAYHAKYDDRYPKEDLGPVVGSETYDVTLRLTVV